MVKESVKDAKHKRLQLHQGGKPMPTAYGGKASFKDAAQMLKLFRENAISVEEAQKREEEKLVTKSL